jgi:hypothetical protein
VLGGDAQDVRLPGPDLHHQRDVQAPEEHGVGSKRSQARIPAAWEDRNCLQVADVRRGRGREPGPGGSFPCRCGTRGRGVHPGCGGAPPRVLPGQPPDQLTDLRRGRRAPGGIRIGPLFLIMRRCQASRVPGATIRCSCRCPGSSRASAAVTARSAQSGLGRAT